MLIYCAVLLKKKSSNRYKSKSMRMKYNIRHMLSFPNFYETILMLIEKMHFISY